MKRNNIDKYDRESYEYVGPKRIREESNLNIGGERMLNLANIESWLNERKSELVHHTITVTFIVNTQEELVICSRYTEHVVCAEGKDVLAAGEITFCKDKNEWYISEISNQSTGYCPKPECWDVISLVLKRIGIMHPVYFTHAYEFRFCDVCENINLIKDEVFNCMICGEDLPLTWNFKHLRE